MSEYDNREKKDDAVLITFIAAILLSGRNYPNPSGPAKDCLAMLDEEKSIAITEASDLLAKARKTCGV